MHQTTWAPVINLAHPKTEYPKFTLSMRNISKSAPVGFHGVFYDFFCLLLCFVCAGRCFIKRNMKLTTSVLCNILVRVFFGHFLCLWHFFQYTLWYCLKFMAFFKSKKKVGKKGDLTMLENNYFLKSCRMALLQKAENILSFSDIIIFDNQKCTITELTPILVISSTSMVSLWLLM